MTEQPLLTPTVISSPAPIPTAASATPAQVKSSGSNVVFALFLFVLVAVVALWANYEASKGFDIVVTNAAGSTPAGRRFGLLFVENGRAARLILAMSDSVERVLYPDESFPRKPVARVTLYMVDAAAGDGDGLDGTVAVGAGRGAGEFVVRMSPAVMEAADVRAAVAAAVLRGMARVWLRDGRGKAPRAVIDAVVEYLAEPYAAPAAIVDVAGFNASSSSSSSLCWEDREHAGSFVRYCELKREGFVARLNRAMEEEWQDQMVDDALLGSPSALLCSAYRSLLQRQDDV